MNILGLDLGVLAVKGGRVLFLLAARSQGLPLIWCLYR